MARHPVFFFDQKQPHSWKVPASLHRGRKTNNSTANYHNVKALISHS
jgi:hypothetical protein